jgi:aminotransferase
MSQHAGLAALTEGEAYVTEMVAEYDRRRRFLVNGLNALGLPTIEPKGAFYAFPQVGHFGLSSKEFAKQLLIEGQVAIIPGSAFGACGEGYARVCYATSMENISRALERIEKFLRSKGWMESIDVQAGVAHNVWNAGRFAAGPNS